jgi:hypothetical protein
LGLVECKQQTDLGPGKTLSEQGSSLRKRPSVRRTARSRSSPILTSSGISELSSPASRRFEVSHHSTSQSTIRRASEGEIRGSYRRMESLPGLSVQLGKVRGSIYRNRLPEGCRRWDLWEHWQTRIYLGRSSRQRARYRSQQPAAAYPTVPSDRGGTERGCLRPSLLSERPSAADSSDR